MEKQSDQNGSKKKAGWHQLQSCFDGRLIDQVVSCLQKAIRRGDEELAFSMAYEMVESGFAKYMWNRLGVIVCEDIGTADPQIAMLVDNCANIFLRRMNSAKKGPFNYQAVALAVLTMCRAQKSRECDEFCWWMVDRIKKNGPPEIPGYAIDQHTDAGRKNLKDKGLSKAEIEYLFWTDGGKIKNAKKSGSRYFMQAIRDEPHMTDEMKEECILLWDEIYDVTDDQGSDGGDDGCR